MKIGKNRIQKFKRKLNEENIQELNYRLNKENWNNLFLLTDVNKQYDEFLNIFNYYYNISCPVVKYFEKDNKPIPWMNKDIKKAKDNMFLTYSNWRKAKTSINKRLYIEKKNSYCKLMLETKSNFIHETLQYSNNLSKDSWKIINSTRNTCNKNHVNQIQLIENNSLITNPNKIADLFNTFFVNIADNISLDCILAPDTHIAMGNVTSNKSLNKFEKINLLELKKVFAKMKSKSSCDKDGVSMRVFKACSVEILRPLLLIINTSIETGVFPINCKIAKVKPIFKKDNMYDKNNYRPISLLPVTSKLIEKVIGIQLMNYIEENNIVNKKQYGFRKSKSTKLALIDFVNECVDAMEAGESAVGCFADLTKAFDCVNIRLLLKKIEKIGIKGKAYNWLKSYLENRTQFTEMTQVNANKVKSVRSKEAQITSGVPQGSILGPILFLIYIHDITEVIPPINLFQFADDTTILTRNRDPELLEIESFCKINQLAQYFSEIKLKLNPIKTSYMHIQTKQRQISKNNVLPALSIAGNELQIQNSTVFLGVILDNTLSWNDHLNKLENTIAKNLFVLRSLSKYNNLKLSKMIYHGLIESHLAYSVVLWGGYKSLLERAFIWQKKAIRAIANIPPLGHCSDAFKRMGILTLPSLYILECVMYVRSNLLEDLQDSQHNYSTRASKNAKKFFQSHKLSKFEKKPSYIGKKLYQALPAEFKDINTLSKFKQKVKNLLINQCLYSVNDYWELVDSYEPITR